MKKIFLLSGCVLLAANAHAQSPIQQGDLDFIVKPIGENAVGLRYATSDQLAVYGVLDTLFLQNDDMKDYDTSTDSYEAHSKSRDPSLALRAGLQYFFMEGAYVSGSAGFYSRTDATDFETGASEETTTFTLYGIIDLGFEHSLSDRLAIHAEYGLEIGNPKFESVEKDATGDQTDGYETDRFYMDSNFTFGLSYTLN